MPSPARPRALLTGHRAPTPQCIPYVINQAREAMLQILEWRFVVRDEGEADVPADPSWQEDEEPAPCTTDAWAQGSVRVLPARPHLEEAEVPSAGLPEDTPATEEALRDAAGATQGSLLREEETEGWPAGPSLEKVVELPCGSSPSSKGHLVSWAEAPPGKAASVPPPPPQPRFSRQQLRGQSLHTTRFEQVVQPLESSEKELLLRELSQVPLEEEGLALLPSSCSNLLRIQLGRPPNIKAVFYDESGNITLAPRLDPARLPKRWIKPSVEVVDPDVESRRQEALKTVSGRCPPRRPPKLPRGWVDARDLSGALPVPTGAPQVLLWDGAALVLQKRLPEQAPCPAQPPPGRALEPSSLVFVRPTLLAECVEPAPGVTIRPGGTTARRPPPAAPPTQEQEAEAAAAVPRNLPHPLRPLVPLPQEAPAEQQGVPEPRPLPRLRPGTVL